MEMKITLSMPSTISSTVSVSRAIQLSGLVSHSMRGLYPAKTREAPCHNAVRMSDTTTQGIRVQVESFYDEDRSSPQESYYFFAYQVRISNVGTEKAQL